MKKDYQITDEMMGLKLDTKTKPQRFAIATNALLVIRNVGKRYLVLVNIDPEKLNKWYPCFVSHNASHQFVAENYSGLISEFKREIENRGFQEEKRKYACIEYVENLFGQRINTPEFKKLKNDEWWIKYSISQKIWTVYLFENYEMIINEALEAKPNIAFLPIDSQEDNEWIDTGIYKDIEIVDNIYSLLKNGLFKNKK